MSSVVISGNTSGTITLDAPNVAGTTVLTLPTANGTVLTTANTFGAGTGPTFSAYQSSTQTLTASGYTKIQIQTEEWDTNSNYDNATNYRFTPTVAGYYQVNGSIRCATNGELAAIIYKNGSAAKNGSNINTNSVYSSIVSALIYFNGSTDYAELYAFCSAANTTIAGASYTYFQAAMVRSA